MIDYKAELNTIEETIQERKLEKAKLEERLKTLTEEEKKLTDELTELGIKDVSKLKEWIGKQQTELDIEIKKLKEVLGL